MRKMITTRQVLLSFCAIGVLTAGNTAWADFDVNNCVQVTATAEDDSDSKPNNKGTTADILTAVNGNTNEDDEACAVTSVKSIYDWGDAPDFYGTTGASHEIFPDLHLGATVEPEANGQPSVAADLDGTEEDGVNIPSLTDGQALTLSVTATNTSPNQAKVICWIDYDGDGVFATDGSESGGAEVPMGSTDASIDVIMPQVPATAFTDTGGSSYARCRLTTDTVDASSATGALSDGEVEDYLVSFVAQPQFDLALRKLLKTNQASNVRAGDTVNYTIQVINQGGIDASDIEIVDYIPAGMTLSDTNWTASDDGASATLNTPIPSLPAGETTTVSISLVVDASATTGSKENAAEIMAAKDGSGNPATDNDSIMDNNPANETGIVPDVVDNSGGDEDDHDTVTITVDPTVDISVSKTVDKAIVRRGETLVYTLTATNKGPDNATGVVVTDQLPATLTYVSDSSGGAYDAGTGNWSVGDLAKGASRSINIEVTVKSRTP